MNYYDPASQLGLEGREPLPQLSTLSPWSLLTYQLDSALLQPPTPIRQPPVALMLAYRVDDEMEERLVYGGEHGASEEEQEDHLERAQEFWNPRPHIDIIPSLVAHPPSPPPSPPLAPASPAAVDTNAAADYFDMSTPTPPIPSMPLLDMAPHVINYPPPITPSTPNIVHPTPEHLNATQVPQYTVDQFESPASSSSEPYYPSMEFTMAVTDMQHAVSSRSYYPPFVPSQHQGLFYDVGEGSSHQTLLDIAAQDHVLEGQHDVPMTLSSRNNTVSLESTLSGWSI